MGRVQPYSTAVNVGTDLNLDVSLLSECEIPSSYSCALFSGTVCKKDLTRSNKGENKYLLKRITLPFIYLYAKVYF